MPANVRITVPERMKGVKGNEEAKDIFLGVKGRGEEKGGTGVGIGRGSPSATDTAIVNTGHRR